MIGQVGHVLVGLADSIMIGRLGTAPLAAAAFANSIFIIPMIFGIGMAIGLTTPVANADGQGKPLLVRSYLKHGLYTMGGLALFLGLLLVAIQGLLPYFGQEAAVSRLAQPYFGLLSLSLLPLLLFLTGKQFAEGLSDTRPAMAISIGANLINIGLNYLLIYGTAGFPALGLNGAGLATLIARVLMALGMTLYVFRKPAFRAYTQAIRWGETRRAHFRKLLQLGIPSGLQYVFEVSAFAAAAVMMGWISAEALAAHQVAISLASVSYMAASGFGTAANVRVSNQLGAQRPQVMEQAGYTNFYAVLVFMLFWGLLYAGGRHYFPTWYSEDPRVVQLAAELLLVAIFFQLSDGLQVAALGALRGLSDTRIPTLITFGSYWLLGVGGAYLAAFVFSFQALGIWFGLALGLTGSAVFLTWRFVNRCRHLAATPINS
jgi:MATE family multidrug resistance protein